MQSTVYLDQSVTDFETGSLGSDIMYQGQPYTKHWLEKEDEIVSGIITFQTSHSVPADDVGQAESKPRSAM